MASHTEIFEVLLIPHLPEGEAMKMQAFSTMAYLHILPTLCETF